MTGRAQTAFKQLHEESRAEYPACIKVRLGGTGIFHLRLLHQDDYAIIAIIAMLCIVYVC